MQMLTTEAAQAEIINEDFTSPEIVLPLPSFDQSLQRLPQQAFWRWTIQNLPWFWFMKHDLGVPFDAWLISATLPESAPLWPIWVP